jgi:signal transduction histidine kinase
MQAKLRSLAHQVLSAQENERREISRELHDEVVQTLVGINVELAALAQAAAVGTEAFRAKIANTQQLVERSVNAVHQFARDLRPAVLDDLGLIPALEALMKSVAARNNLRIRRSRADRQRQTCGALPVRSGSTHQRRPTRASELGQSEHPPTTGRYPHGNP